jgi:hypothetical protein
LALFFVVILIVNDLVISAVATPATDAMLLFLFAGLDYLGQTADPSLGLLYFSLASVGLYYLFSIAVMALGVWIYLARVLRILRLRFHEKVPLRSHSGFWKWGTLAVIWVQVLPMLFAYLGWPVIEMGFRALVEADPPQSLAGLLLAGSLLLFGSVVVFWLARGFRSLRYLWRYRVPRARLAQT